MKENLIRGLKLKVTDGWISAFCLCLMPILEPYIFFSIADFDIYIADVMLAAITVHYVWKNRSLVWCKGLFCFSILLLALNYFAFLAGPSSVQGIFGTTQRIWLFWMFYCAIFTATVASCDYAIFEKCILYVAVFACVLMLVQFVFVAAGIPFWNGKIPFLGLGKYDDWAAMVDVNGAIRVHSFFQEPSYVGVFLLPVIALALQQKKYIHAGLFIVCVFLSTSTLAIGGMCMVAGLHILQEIIMDRKAIRKYAIGAGWIILVGTLAALLIPSVRTMLGYSFKKIINVFSDLGNSRMGSTKLRIFGNIFLFPDYSPYNMLFGVGINQYVNVFADRIEYSYSNSFVTILLNSGIIGWGAFIAVIVGCIKKCSLQNKIFPVIFIFVMATDLTLYDWKFFYLFFWMLYGITNSGGEIGLITITWDAAKKCYRKGMRLIRKGLAK